ncbi:MAG TPA: AI-2E family transporter [Chitinophagaceae bacterium]|nr:AI-2E family transporter [Chitinophagaceae bacterium]
MIDKKTNIESKNFKTYPFYIRATVTLFGLSLFIFALHTLADVLIPFAIAGLVAILLNPLNNNLERRLPRLVAIILTLLIALVATAGIFYFLSVQFTRLGENWPLIKQRFTELLTQVQNWLVTDFGISAEKQINVMKGGLNGNTQIVGQTLGTVFGALGVAFLVPIYVFLLLFYKPLILNFLFQLFLEQHSLRVAEVLGETKNAIQSYMKGLMIETAIVAMLNSSVLLLLGVPYAILIGVIGALLNLLPYIGGVIAIILPVLSATIKFDGFTTQLIIIAAYLVIQFIDNNILVPRIVSSKVQINALMSILSVLLGGTLWGLSGMFLAIPFIAVLKIIFDRTEGMKPWGTLLGDEVPSEHIGVEWQKRWNRIFRRLEKEKKEAAVIAAGELENNKTGTT